MNRYRSFGGLDERPLYDGDTGFYGVDERDPAQVQPGFVSEAVNLIFAERVAAPRLGTVAPVWGSGTSYASLGTAQGGAVFNDPNGVEWVLVCAGNHVYATREGSLPVDLFLPSRPVLPSQVRFTQCMGKMVMHRGPVLTPYIMDNIGAGFRVANSLVANTISGAGTHNPSDGTELMPAASNGVWLQNRLFVPHERDLVAASDFLNPERYAPVRADFRINQGSEDGLVALHKFGDASLVAFKSASVYLVNNVYGDLSGIRQEELTREYGLVAQRAVCSVGDDVWFLSQRGVTSIGQTLQNKVRASRETWSDPIYRTMKRINAQYVSGATAAFFDGKFYLAVPLDDAKLENAAGTLTGVNNAVLVYDFDAVPGVGGAWCGVWSGGNLAVKEWLQVTCQGKQRLGFLSADGLVYLLEMSYSDDVRAGATGIQAAEFGSRFVSRGYTLDRDADGRVLTSGKGSSKRFTELAVGVSTWKPSFSVSIQFEGAGESVALVTSRTKNRRKYYKPFTKADWVTSNVNDDHGTKFREDYSVDSSVAGGGIVLGSGVNFEQHQETIESFGDVRGGEGRYAQVVVAGLGGRTVVKSVQVCGRRGRNRRGSMA